MSDDYVEILEAKVEKLEARERASADFGHVGDYAAEIARLKVELAAERQAHEETRREWEKTFAKLERLDADYVIAREAEAEAYGHYQIAAAQRDEARRERDEARAVITKMPRANLDAGWLDPWDAATLKAERDALAERVKALDADHSDGEKALMDSLDLALASLKSLASCLVDTNTKTSVETIVALVAERDALEAKLKEARAKALEEAAKQCDVKGRVSFEREVGWACSELAEEIRALAATKAEGES